MCREFFRSHQPAVKFQGAIQFGGGMRAREPIPPPCPPSPEHKPDAANKTQAHDPRRWHPMGPEPPEQESKAGAGDEPGGHGPKGHGTPIPLLELHDRISNVWHERLASTVR